VRVCAGTESFEEAGDAQADSSASRRIAGEWLRAGILVRDPRPSFYVYRQTFAATVGGVDDRFSRIGLVAILDPGAVVGNPGNGVPAEQAASLAVHLHDQPSAGFAGLLEAAKPVHLRFLDEHSVEHSLQVLDDPETVRALQGALRNLRTVPLDGLRSASGPHPALLVAADDPGLVLQPVHRIYRHLDPAALDSAEGTLRAAFAVEELPYLGADAAEALLATLPEDVHGFAFRRRDSDSILLLQVPFSDGAHALDSDFLGETFDRAVLSRPQERDHRIERVTEGHRAMERLDSDPEASLAILLRPVGTQTLFSLAGADPRDPAIAPLHPRPWSGLVSFFPDA
jgi:hypothetical protein